MNKLIVLCGIPGCGKSTWAKKYVAEHANTVIISRDAVRFNMLKDGDDYFSNEKKVFKTYISEIERCWEEGLTVIADATHLNHASRAKLINALDRDIVNNHLWLEFVNFSDDLEVAIMRNNEREGRAFVPISAIRRMYYQYEPATIKEWPGLIMKIRNINSEGEEV